MIEGGEFASSPGGEANLPEEGTQTGISVGLDEWDSGGGDVVGISVRVDNLLVNQTPLTVRNGSATDTNSLQTGPANRPLDDDFSVPDHTFVNLTIKLDEDGTLDVIYKGRAILDNFQTEYFPSRGRIIFAGRTGGSNAHHHVDNIVITTVAANEPTVTTLTLTPLELRAVIADSDSRVVDTTKPITLTLDGNALTATVTKDGANTTLVVPAVLPNFFANGIHAVVISASDTNNNPITFTREVTTAAYTDILPAWKAAAGQVDPGSSGFRARVHQLGFARYPGDTNTLPLPERQLAGGYFDSSAVVIAENVAEPGTEFDGAYVIGEVIDWDEAGGAIGNFQGAETVIPGIPGSTGSTDHIVAEIFTWLELPVGVHTLGVNSDDGFTVSFGANALDHFTRVKAGEFNGGRGAADTTFRIAVAEAGLYPVRLLWWEGEGGANLEFFSVLPDGTKVLINDVDTDGHFKAFYGGLPALPAIHTIAPYPDTIGNDPRHPITIELVDGVATVNEASIVLTINGTVVTPTITSEGFLTRVSYLSANGTLPPAPTLTIKLDYQDSASNARSETWSFAAPYQVLEIADGVPAAQAGEPGFTAKVYQVARRDGTDSAETVNRNDVTDDILAGAYGPNEANLSGATDGVFTFGAGAVVNWSQLGEPAGNFQDPEGEIPGIPGANDNTDNIAAEVRTWLVFPAPGFYTMGVNSDDNFRVTLDHGSPTRNLLEVTGSATLSGPLPSVDGSRAYGSIAAPHIGIVEGAVVAAEPIQANAPLTNAASVAGKIVYVDRSTVSFAQQVRHAQAAGAIAVIVGNHNAGYPIVMPGDGSDLSTITIPAVMTSTEAGASIKAALTAGDPLRASLGYDASRRFGEFNDGRGATDTTFLIDVRDAGAYPFRLSWKEGGGGANLEWFTVLADGTKVLVNDAANAASIKAYLSVSAQPPVGGTILVTDFTADRAAGSFSVTWQSTAGKTYKIDTSLSLATESWQNLATGIAAGAGSTTTFTGSNATLPTLPSFTTESRVFFRIVEE